ncbi:MAG: glycosyltransferase family 29 protein [Acetobacteraceae bacterium]|nr:glycosyltransferase family 29 protein [Acetobacteraceae bacterium]
MTGGPGTEGVGGLIARFRAAPPLDRPGILASALPALLLTRNTAERIWDLRAEDPSAFDAGLDRAAAVALDHPLVFQLLAWREVRAERHERVKDLARLILRLDPRRHGWRLRLARAELLSPTRDAAEREAVWALALPAFPQGLPLAALRAQRAISRGREPDLGRFEVLLARQAAAALALPSAEAAGGADMVERLAAIYRRLRAARDVALVGNAPTLSGSGAGREIDRHDLVVRCNYPPIAGFESDVGGRADLMLLHGAKRHGLAERLRRDPRYPKLPALSCGPASPRGEPPPLPPDDEPRPAAPDALERLVDQLCYPEWTTGLFGAVLIGLVFGRPLRLYGFDFFRPGSAGHYYGGAGAAPHHDVAYERWYLTRVLPALRPGVTLHGSVALSGTAPATRAAAD